MGAGAVVDAFDIYAILDAHQIDYSVGRGVGCTGGCDLGLDGWVEQDDIDKHRARVIAGVLEREPRRPAMISLDDMPTPPRGIEEKVEPRNLPLCPGCTRPYTRHDYIWTNEDGCREAYGDMGSCTQAWCGVKGRYV